MISIAKKTIHVRRITIAKLKSMTATILIARLMGKVMVASTVMKSLTSAVLSILIVKTISIAKVATSSFAW